MNQRHSSEHRIRILFLCHDGKVYGAQKSLKLLVENLPRDKYKVYVSFSRSGPLVEMLKAIPDVTVLSHQRLQGVKHTQRNIFQRIGYFATLFLNMGRVLPLISMIQKHQIDIVHTNSLVSFEGAFAAKLAGVPHVWHIRELFQDYNPRFYLVVGKTLTKALVNSFSTRVLCVSNYVRQQFQPYSEQTPNKYQVLYNAIEGLPEDAPPASTFETNKDVLNLVYCGRVSDGKRFQDIIDAFCILKDRWQDKMPFHLKVYGDFICPDFEGMVRSKIKTSSLEGCFELLGYRDSMDECIAGADLLLMPSSTEAFGRIMLEALVRGIPVVTSRSGAPLEVIEEGKCGFFHTPNNPQDLAACIEEIYAKRADLPQMHQWCIDHVRQKFDLNKQIQNLDKIYEEILRRNPSARAIPRPCWHGS